LVEIKLSTDSLTTMSGNPGAHVGRIESKPASDLNRRQDAPLGEAVDTFSR
jgi:hypothetical protein